MKALTQESKCFFILNQLRVDLKRSERPKNCEQLRSNFWGSRHGWRLSDRRRQWKEQTGGLRLELRVHPPLYKSIYNFSRCFFYFKLNWGWTRNAVSDPKIASSCAVIFGEVATDGDISSVQGCWIIFRIKERDAIGRQLNKSARQVLPKKWLMRNLLTQAKVLILILLNSEN